MKAIPKIDKVMTGMPHSINSDLPMKKAKELMREGQYRHLPVQHGGKLVGVVTDRDIALAGNFQGAAELSVEDVMTQDPYTCKLGTDLDVVVAEMAERKLGCAVVVQDNEKVVGIFTATDGLRFLAEVLNQRFHK